MPGQLGGGQFSIGQWRAYREKIRWLWEIVRLGGGPGSLGQFGKNGIFQPEFTVEGPNTWSIPAQEGDHFAYERGQLVYRTATLLGFLTLDVLSVPREYLQTPSARTALLGSLWLTIFVKTTARRFVSSGPNGFGRGIGGITRVGINGKEGTDVWPCSNAVQHGTRIFS
jgi:hypothetical protein